MFADCLELPKLLGSEGDGSEQPNLSLHAILGSEFLPLCLREK